MKKYYEAYDERYKAVHQKGYGWFGGTPTPIVREIIDKYAIDKNVPMLEIGCGEGRDAVPLLKDGYALLATDVSAEAVAYCRNTAPAFADRFEVLDCLNSKNSKRYGFIFAVAVIHMLLPDEDRNGFYRFIKEHLTDGGIALICSQGDGVTEKMTDINDAFVLQKREHPSGGIEVAGTTFRMISFANFEKEITYNGLRIIEKGFTDGAPEYFNLMYAVVTRKRK